MISIRKRNTALEAISMVMLEKGRILDKHDYERVEERTSVRAGTVLNLFGSWSRMLGIMETSLPEVWEQIRQKEYPPVVSKPVTPKVPKPVLKAKVKPATAVKLGKDDE